MPRARRRSARPRGDARSAGSATEPTAAAFSADPAAARRDELRSLHRGFGIASWAALTATLVLGAFQYADQYGFFGPYDETPCARGEALLGQLQCDVPIAHLSAAVLTGALYATAFSLSVLVRDPSGARSLDPASPFARRLPTHRMLRWVHLAGMAGQIALGVIFANLDSMGVDVEDHFTMMQAFATWHMAVGALTWASLTAAGAMMLF